MSTEANKTLVRHFWDGVFNQKNLAVIDEVCAANCVLYDPSGPIQGREALKQFIGMYLGAFPDFHVTIEDIIAEGDKVVVRNTWRATDLQSGQRIEFGGVVIWRMVDGKLAERWAYLQAPYPI